MGGGSGPRWGERREGEGEMRQRGKGGFGGDTGFGEGAGRLFFEQLGESNAGGGSWVLRKGFSLFGGPAKNGPNGVRGGIPQGAGGVQFFFGMRNPK